MDRVGIEAVYEFIKRLREKDLRKKIRAEDRKKIEDIILQNAINGEIPCATCLSIADDLGISKKELIKIINEMKIKISHCQLGCFE